MNWENRPLVTDEPAEFGKLPVEVQDLRKIIDDFRGVYEIYLTLIKKNQKISTCNQLDVLGALGF